MVTLSSCTSVNWCSSSCLRVCDVSACRTSDSRSDVEDNSIMHLRVNYVMEDR